MKIYIYIIELIFSLALLMNALLFIPQSLRIWREKSTQGVSFITFLGFFLIQFAIVLHGLIVKDYLLSIGLAFSMLTCSSVIVLIIYFRRKHRHTAREDLTDKKMS